MINASQAYGLGVEVFDRRVKSFDELVVKVMQNERRLAAVFFSKNADVVFIQENLQAVDPLAHLGIKVNGCCLLEGLDRIK